LKHSQQSIFQSDMSVLFSSSWDIFMPIPIPENVQLHNSTVPHTGVHPKGARGAAPTKKRKKKQLL
jgi:hypothetical protein